MQKQIIAALFDSLPKAERAIAELRDCGVSDEAISVVTVRHEGDAEPPASGGHLGDHVADGRRAGIGKGLATGGAVGLIGGLALLVVPGLGPFVAAGAIGEAFRTAGSALLVSGAVGATAGGLAGALVDYGMDLQEAEAFERRIRDGATLVTVETYGSERWFASARAILRAAGGETADAQGEAGA